ncbi:penicillin-binding protein 2 [Methylotuvimicrobium sp. KM1]|uniref:penicillin-binding protein 2 n=1 Tax=Methylotuvimicrobium sp. KM1 TaxID=3377707 RepID=UPI00385004B9
MPRTYTIKNPAEENRIFTGRAIVALIFILLLSIGLIVRLVYLQIVGHEHYATLAKNNHIKISPLPPTRGIIFDRKGRVLADNVPTYSLELIPEQIKDFDDTLARLQELLDIPEDKIEQYQKLRKREKRFTSTPLLLRMSEEEIAKFAAVRPYFPGVDIHARLVRHYPYNILTSHVIGYVGRINENELKRLPVSEYRGTHHVGKVGIELAYETELHGKAGYAEIETNAQSRAISTLKTVDPTAGSNLHLTLDIDLQKIAYDALDIYNGAVVAIEIKTGGVLVFTSRPGFDPNPFVYGIDSKSYKELQTSDAQPMFNRALRGQYPPGSTIKPFMALAGLEYQVTHPGQKTYCPGYFQLPNVKHKYRDWKRGGHGTVDLNLAIVQSCDVYFYSLALSLGIDNIHRFFTKFGFGEKSGIDLVGELSGLQPSKQWKRKARNQSWYPGETVITGIGQGYTQVTPLQLARATATLANRGKVVHPHLVGSFTDNGILKPVEAKPEISLALNPRNIDAVVSAMINVVHSARGTARVISRGIDYQIAGKTGTAQVFTVKQEKRYNENEIAFKLRDHALFMAFAPAHDPQIAVAVIAENGGHGGSVAAPIAGKIIRQYLQESSDEDRNAQ